MDASYVAKERVILAPDCGMKYMSREAAVGKLKSMVEAAQLLRAQFGAG
jgi:5-methyltetrahydropteroyltriglutamate--homocysteine methyltransferase